MAVTAGVALVTAAEVAGITQEKELSNLDDAGSGATLAAALISATLYVVADLKARGIQPSTVSNPEDLQLAAAWKVVALCLGGGDEKQQARAKVAEANYREQVGKYVYESNVTGDDQLDAADMGPVVVNQDAYASFPGFNNGPPPSGAGPFRVGR